MMENLNTYILKNKACSSNAPVNHVIAEQKNISFNYNEFVGIEEVFVPSSSDSGFTDSLAVVPAKAVLKETVVVSNSPLTNSVDSISAVDQAINSHEDVSLSKIISDFDVELSAILSNLAEVVPEKGVNSSNQEASSSLSFSKHFGGAGIPNFFNKEKDPFKGFCARNPPSVSNNFVQRGIVRLVKNISSSFKSNDGVDASHLSQVKSAVDSTSKTSLSENVTGSGADFVEPNSNLSLFDSFWRGIKVKSSSFIDYFFGETQAVKPADPDPEAAAKEDAAEHRFKEHQTWLEWLFEKCDYDWDIIYYVLCALFLVVLGALFWIFLRHVQDFFHRKIAEKFRPRPIVTISVPSAPKRMPPLFGETSAVEQHDQENLIREAIKKVFNFFKQKYYKRFIFRGRG